MENIYSANLPEKADIKKAVNDYCKEKALSKAGLSIQCGVSDATLCALEKEKWSDLSQGMLLKLWNFVTRDKVEYLYQSIDLKSTLNACEKARKYHFMIGITADTGMGKTTALRTYARQKNVFYVAYDKTMNPNQFFSALMRELALPYNGTLNDMINRITDEINRMESPLIIIDEAGKLTHSMILYLHVLRDKTNGNCGIILGGMPYFKTNLQKFAMREKEGYAEFLRRVNIWHSLEGLKAKEVEDICTLHGVTDKDKVRELRRHKRFGDLMNDIHVYKTIRGDYD